MADVVIVISKFEEDLLRRSGFSIKRFELVTPGVDLMEFEAPGVNIYQRYGLDNSKIVLFVGRLSYEKGIDILIKAASQVLKREPETTFFIVGPDFGEQDGLEREVQRQQIANKVVFAGPFSRQDLISAFKNAHVMAFPSRYELFGIVLVESMAAGTPIVATNATAIPYAIDDGETGLLFSPGDSAGLADSILELLQNERLREEMGKRGQEVVRERFDLALQIEKLEEVYESLL